MELNILNIKGEETGKKVQLNDAIFGIEPNDHAIYLDVKQFMANNRQGTHKSKQRSEIAGSTRKLGRQKGGGGARPGDIKSPVRVGGGRIFGPVPRDYSFKLNKNDVCFEDCRQEGIVRAACSRRLCIAFGSQLAEREPDHGERTEYVRNHEFYRSSGSSRNTCRIG